MEYNRENVTLQYEEGHNLVAYKYRQLPSSRIQRLKAIIFKFYGVVYIKANNVSMLSAANDELDEKLSNYSRNL